MPESITRDRAWENGKGPGFREGVGKINTVRLSVDTSALDSEQSQAALREAAAILRAGGTVAFPTETVYGLGANALNSEAVRRIFEAKQRPSWDPLIVHVTNPEQLRQVAGEIPCNAQILMEAFWPGPLTLLLPKAPQLPAIVTAGRPKAGIRMPQHPVARRLIELAGVPVAAPSANSFGRTSPTRAEFVLEDLDGRIDAVIDSGETSLGLESTVIDPCEEPPIVYRPGMVTFEQVQAICGNVVRYSAPACGDQEPASQPSPGVGLKHYAPHAQLILFDSETNGPSLFEAAESLRMQGETVGIMLPDGKEHVPSPLVYPWGKWTDLDELARRLFAGLRQLDAAGATVIVCPLPKDEGIGRAIRDRLLKAARNG
jgi:L-threonylcarbamoyladenylate synthase